MKKKGRVKTYLDTLLWQIKRQGNKECYAEGLKPFLWHE